MEQQFRRPEAERLSPVEAEEVIRRFRDEEEQRQREMEAQATNPTVADLAEGLGVPPERIASLLAQVRGDAVPPAPFRPAPITAQDAATQVRRSNQTAWIIAGLITGAALLLMMLASVFLFSSTAAEQRVPATIETPQPPTPDATAPEAEVPNNTGATTP